MWLFNAYLSLQTFSYLAQKSHFKEVSFLLHCMLKIDSVRL